MRQAEDRPCLDRVRGNRHRRQGPRHRDVQKRRKLPLAGVPTRAEAVGDAAQQPSSQELSVFRVRCRQVLEKPLGGDGQGVIRAREEGLGDALAAERALQLNLQPMGYRHRH